MFCNIYKIIIVQHRFGLSTPKTQRMLAASKIYSKNGIEVHFLYSNSNDEKPEDLYPSIHFKRIEEKGRIDFNSYRKFYKAIKSLYDSHTAILFYDIPYYSILFKAPRYNVFAEVTEIPLYGLRSSIIKRLLNHLTLLAAKRFTGLFVISNALKKYYHDRGVAHIEIINMFVDRSRFENLNKRNVEKYIGYCGKISIHKDGVDDLIKAFEIFSKQYSDYKLYLFGRFESDLVRDVLMREVRDLDLLSKVVFTGPIDPKEMPQRLLDASILALARPDNKQAQYGFPTKLGEYLSTGNPVVLTAVGEIPQYLMDGMNALVVSPGDYLAFADKLKWIAEHPEKAALIGTAGKELVNTDFSANVQIEKAISFINRLCYILN